jgi:hypothetical protein
MQIRTSRFLTLCVATFALFSLAAPASRAAGPDFTMTTTQFLPSPINQSVSATATLTLQPANNFTGQVNLGCTVSPQKANGPTCVLSQTTVTPPAQPSVTLQTFSNTPAVLYTATVTATSTSSTTVATVILTDTVVVVIPDYTISIDTAISPTSLHAGSGATVVLDITPVSYTGTVTPVCTMITPAVALSPICTFNPATVAVSGAEPVPTTLTISTTGPNTTTIASHTRRFGPMLALWLLIPGFAFCGFAPKRPSQRSGFLRWLFLRLTLSSVLLLPSCSSMSTSTSGNTPNNTYSITISGVDANQVGPSNSSVSVSLTVD